ncbi:MAG: hypothetical protein IPH69_04355 [Bacteroidales bacterium]|nr:hypothetical protein [Bacteroidales bacterium]
MKPIYKYSLILLCINILIGSAGYLYVTYSDTALSLSNILLLTLLFSIIALITIIIFLRGQTKDPESQTLHSFVAIGLKFLLEMFLALVWFIVAKKTSLPSVLIFFVLYLTLTLFSVSIILKTLKSRSL